MPPTTTRPQLIENGPKERGRMCACMDAYATRGVYYSPGGVVSGLGVVGATMKYSGSSSERERK